MSDGGSSIGACPRVPRTDERLTVLVLESDDALRTALALSLEAKGYQTVAVAQPMEARTKRGLRPDLVLIESELFEADGAAFSRQWLRWMDPRPPLVLTTRAPTTAGTAGFGAATCLVKPFTPGELFQAVHRAMRLEYEPSSLSTAWGR
jgi:DNA-binding response OmpR family regulator